MRFEVITAFAIGLMLPVLETCRRGITEWAVDFTTMFEDYLAGALLLAGAWSTYRGRRWGPLFLVVAWAWFTGMMTNSFVVQVEETVRGTISEPNNVVVVVVKFILWITAAVSLALSFRSLSKRVSEG